MFFIFLLGRWFVFYCLLSTIDIVHLTKHIRKCSCWFYIVLQCSTEECNGCCIIRDLVFGVVKRLISFFLRLLNLLLCWNFPQLPYMYHEKDINMCKLFRCIQSWLLSHVPINIKTERKLTQCNNYCHTNDNS